ncbi:MAG: MFS transporter [Phycisphaerae bacterium]|nr:MFS transporter [Phycisphaerae bacterium]
MTSIAPESPHSVGLGFRYWICNVVEMWERLAYYALRAVAPIYIMQATDPGGLHLTPFDKGVIYMVWAIVQSILPTVTGGLADRYGYRRSLAFSLTVNTIGYLLMAAFHSHVGFFSGVVVLAFGTAFFKPGLQGTLAHILTKENSSVGWGWFYMVVNVGSFIGHHISPFILAGHSAGDWRNLFLVCAACTVVNLITLIKFPDIPSGASQTEGVWSVLKRTIVNVAEPRLATWLLIMSCFWMMMYQLWDLQPNFIEDWISSEPLTRHSPVAAWVVTGPDGRPRIEQQVLLSLNSWMIIIGVVPMAWLVRKMRTVSAMLFGMLGATAGVLVAGLTQSAWMLLAGIIGFSIGEMLVGPKKSEYLGLIAPHGKKGLYLGYVNIPTGIGQGLGSLLGGVVYGYFGEKATLSLRYLAEKTDFLSGKVWDGRVQSLEQVTGIPRTRAFATLQEVLDRSGPEVTQLLWDTYAPGYYVWIPFAAIGLIATVALGIYGQMAKRWSDMNA